jgi:hypothetical protein
MFQVCNASEDLQALPTGTMRASPLPSLATQACTVLLDAVCAWAFGISATAASRPGSKGILGMGCPVVVNAPMSQPGLFGARHHGAPQRSDGLL